MFQEYIDQCHINLTLLAQVGFVLLTALIVSFVARRILYYLKTHKELNYWLRTLGDSLFTPSLWFIWGYAFLVIFELFAIRIDIVGLSLNLQQIRNLYFTIGFFWLVLIWKEKITAYYTKKAKKKNAKRFDVALINALSRIATIAIFIVGGLFILDILHVPIAGLLAFGGVGGIAISFAAGDVIKNFFGGLMIYIHRHFVVGDWIMSPNKNFEGVVEEIGWYMTRIRTFERRPLFVPNALMTDAMIENPGRMYNRRIKKKIGVRYQDVNIVTPIINDIKSMLQNHPAIDLSQTLMVELLEFGPYSLDIEVYTFTKTTDWQQWREEQQDILLKIVEIVQKHGGEIAFPTNTVHLEQ